MGSVPVWRAMAASRLRRAVSEKTSARAVKALWNITCRSTNVSTENVPVASSILIRLHGFRQRAVDVEEDEGHGGWIIVRSRLRSMRDKLALWEMERRRNYPAPTGLVGCGCGNLGLRPLGAGSTLGCNIAGRWPLRLVVMNAAARCNVRGKTQPVPGRGILMRLPRVARASQPWADLFEPRWGFVIRVVTPIELFLLFPVAHDVLEAVIVGQSQKFRLGCDFAITHNKFGFVIRFSM